MSEYLVNGSVSLNELPTVAGSISTYIQRHSDKKNWIIGVEGDLGTGKTTLFQSLYTTLSGQWDDTLPQIPIQSPTFTYLKTYEGNNLSVWHVDAYRLKTGLCAEVLSVWDEVLDDRVHILWIEWFTLVQMIEKPDLIINLAHPVNQGADAKIRTIQIRSNMT